jgi:hypothetical protein
MTSLRTEIPADNACCMNCRWMDWHVGVEQGIRCWNPENRANSHPGLRYNGPAPLIPNREFVCEQFEVRLAPEGTHAPDGRNDEAPLERSPSNKGDNSIHASIHASDRDIGRK